MIAWLGDERCHDVRVVGGKAANLSRLCSVHRVPPGFALTPAFAVALQQDGAERHFSTIDEAYLELSGAVGLDSAPVAVRSSALDEDGAHVSFAGQHETFLNVRGASAVMSAVLRCLESATRSEAVAYRQRNGLATDGIGMAVLVQALIPSDVSAVVFSANPVSGDRSEVVVNASWGLGESIVGGTVTPDVFVVRKGTWEIVSATTGDKLNMTVLADDGTREVTVPAMLRSTLSLRTEQAIQAAQIAARLEQTWGWPVDVECAFYGNELHLLQCRPITTLS